MVGLTLITVDPKDRQSIAKAIKKPVRKSITPISAKLILEKDILENLRYAYAINPIGLQNKFAKLGIIINTEEDLIPIANLHATGASKTGFSGSNSQVYAFDAEEILRSVKLNQRAYLKAGIKYIDVITDGDRVKLLK